ncbi:MAG: hypothetical protein ACYS8Y_03320 [Planctomycetota bacterium]|jgi:hypothetical protein
MIKKTGNFIEEHIEKFVLGVVALVCLWFFATGVLFSPNYIEYDNKKFAPGQIDSYILKKSEVLENKLSRKPEPMPPYQTQVDDFVALVSSAIRDIDVTLYPPVPPHYINREKEDGRQYRIPVMSEVNDVAAEHIRAVAYVPKPDIDEENIYKQDNSEPNDIDFVTVEAKFDVAGLYRRFNECFAGEGVQRQWRDPCLAVPVFAAVDLQRQEQLEGDSWGPWHIIPRMKIDPRKSQFEVIKDVKQLPRGGIEVRLLQFDDPVVREDLLQPDAYVIASAEEEWYPPLLHREFLDIQRKIDAEERRKEIAEAEKKKEAEKRGRRGRTSVARGASPPGGPQAGGLASMVSGIMTGSGGPGMSSTSAPRTSAQRGRSSRQKSTRARSDRSTDTSTQKQKPVLTISDVDNKLDGISLSKNKNLNKMKEPLVFWAHDDTVEAGKSYRYRMRMGVFNPIAGKDQFYEQDEHMKKEVILWSDFSGVTDAIEIPERLYLFARDIQEEAKTVTVQVCRYAMGYWYSKDFMVQPGEVIGKVVQNEIEQGKRQQKPAAKSQGSQEQQQQEGLLLPEKIDYSTGAVVVDVVPVTDWGGGKTLRARPYFDMLYSFDGVHIKHMPADSSCWAKDVQNAFGDIQRLLKEEKQPLRPWGRSAIRRMVVPGQRREGGRPGGMQEILQRMFEEGGGLGR